MDGLDHITRAIEQAKDGLKTQTPDERPMGEGYLQGLRYAKSCVAPMLEQLTATTAEVARLTALVDKLHVTVYEQRNEIDDPAKDVENGRLRELLAEFMTDDGDVAVRYDGFACYFCGGLNTHTADCLVRRARAALAEDSRESP